ILPHRNSLESPDDNGIMIEMHSTQNRLAPTRRFETGGSGRMGVFTEMGRGHVNRLKDEVPKWSAEEFTELEDVLRPCIPLVRFFHIPPGEYVKSAS
ncbi:3966_t:CDS:2, partial [Paraglomus occultum]